MSHAFCAECSRIRITADGKLKPCLHSDAEITLRGLSGEELEQAIRRGILMKPERHHMDETGVTETHARHVCDRRLRMELTHFNQQGRARMVDVSEKVQTYRVARAAATVRMAKATMDKIKEGSIGKGDVLAVAQVAGIMAAKKNSELIPMCHPLLLTQGGHLI